MLQISTISTSVLWFMRNKCRSWAFLPWHWGSAVRTVFCSPITFHSSHTIWTWRLMCHFAIAINMPYIVHLLLRADLSCDRSIPWLLHSLSRMTSLCVTYSHLHAAWPHLPEHMDSKDTRVLPPPTLHWTSSSSLPFSYYKPHVTSKCWRSTWCCCCGLIYIADEWCFGSLLCFSLDFFFFFPILV